MSDEKALVPVEQKQVEFYGDELTAVLVENGVVYVPIRPICDYLGVDWSSQRQRIIRDLVLSEVAKGVVVTTTPSTSGRGGGPQEMLCLPLDYLNGWLFGINAQRVKDEVRDTVVRYQRECYRVLADAFLSPVTAVSPTDASDQVLLQLHNMALVIAATTKEMLEAKRLAMDGQRRLDLARDYLRGMNKRISGIDERVTAVEQQIRAGKLTNEQAAEIKKRVNLIAQEMSKHDSGKSHYQEVYAALGDEAGVTSYKDIPPKSFEAAVVFLDNWLKALGERSQG
jgi:hypothetical protein